MKESFEEWYERLLEVAAEYNECVGRKAAWREAYDADQTPEAAFYDEYPEHHPDSDGPP